GVDPLTTVGLPPAGYLTHRRDPLGLHTRRLRGRAHRGRYRRPRRARPHPARLPPGKCLLRRCAVPRGYPHHPGLLHHLPGTRRRGNRGHRGPGPGRAAGFPARGRRGPGGAGAGRAAGGQPAPVPQGRVRRPGGALRADRRLVVRADRRVPRPPEPPALRDPRTGHELRPRAEERKTMSSTDLSPGEEFARAYAKDPARAEVRFDYTITEAFQPTQDRPRVTVRNLLRVRPVDEDTVRFWSE